MSNATLCMYKGPASGLKDKLVHWSICLLDSIRQSVKRGQSTPVIYSHVELLIDGVCYSSSSRDGGVRSKIIEDLETSGHWDLFPVTIDKEQAIARFLGDAGKHYSWVAMERVLFPLLPRRDATQRFCSDEVAYMLGDPDPETLSPYDVRMKYAEANPS